MAFALRLILVCVLSVTHTVAALEVLVFCVTGDHAEIELAHAECPGVVDSAAAGPMAVQLAEQPCQDSEIGSSTFAATGRVVDPSIDVEVPAPVAILLTVLPPAPLAPATTPPAPAPHADLDATALSLRSVILLV